MPVPGVMPDWVCIMFLFWVLFVLPLKSWLRDYAAAVKDRNERVRPTYRHEVD